jgi:hypothetical protein
MKLGNHFSVFFFMKLSSSSSVLPPPTEVVASPAALEQQQQQQHNIIIKHFPLDIFHFTRSSCESHPALPTPFSFLDYNDVE